MPRAQTRVLLEVSIMASMAAAAGLLVALTTSHVWTSGDLSVEARVICGVTLTVVMAVLVARTAILPSSVAVDASIVVWAAPIVLGTIVMTFFSAGVGPFLPHQAVWLVIAVLTGIFTAANLERARMPLWLVGYLVGAVTGAAFAGSSFSAIYDAVLSAIVLWVAWIAAGVLSRPGGVMALLKVLSIMFWALFVVALIVKITGISLGSMTPMTVTLPWEAGIGRNYDGYGAFTVQGARELAVIVAIYHAITYRLGSRRLIHLALAIVAFGMFLTFYGRIPMLGGTLALVLALSTSRRSTNLWPVTAAVVLLAVAGTQLGGSLDVFALRLRSLNWDTGHLTLWGQHLTLFANDMLTGVGAKPTTHQFMQAYGNPLVRPDGFLSLTDLFERGARGEGGWTGLLAQRGVIGGSVILGLLGVAARGLVRRLPRDPLALQDAIVLRAVIPASFVWYLTDVPPGGFYNLAPIVVTQLTMIAAMREVRSRRFA